MNRVRAMIVGISRYAVPGWAQAGPARNAGRIAATLIGLGLPVERLHLFSTLEDCDANDRAALAAAGVTAGATDSTTIDNFCRGTLAELAQAGDQLIIFWSGHGMTDHEDRRIFFCSDFTERLNNRVFDATGFAAQLTAPPLDLFADQLLFADACGNYLDVATAPARPTLPVRNATTRQLTIWASPDGEYASAPDGMGVFTLEVAGLLNEIGLSPWPDEQRVVDAMRERTMYWPYPPTRIDRRGMLGLYQGYAGESPARELLVQNLCALLLSMPIAQIARDAHSLTARALGLKPGARSTIPEFVGQLAELQESWNTNVTFGLTQFLLRITHHPDIDAADAARVRDWVETNATASVRGDVARLLAEERQRRLLLMDVVTNTNGALERATAHLRYPDLAPVAGFGERAAVARDWAALEAFIRGLLDELTGDGESELDVHVLLEPPAFPLPFHQIELRSGRQLGQEHVCVIHCRKRAQLRSGRSLDVWQAWARAMSDEIDLDAVRAVPAHGTAVSELAGIYYVEAPMSASPSTWRQISTLLLLGAPYLCWPFEDPAGVPEFPKSLRDLIGERRQAIAVPELLQTERLRGCTKARAIAILWDGPEFRPFAFQQLKGVA